jgi:hypothetical protein
MPSFHIQQVVVSGHQVVNVSVTMVDPQPFLQVGHTPGAVTVTVGVLGHIEVAQGISSVVLLNMIQSGSGPHGVCIGQLTSSTQM